MLMFWVYFYRKVNVVRLNSRLYRKIEPTIVPQSSFRVGDITNKKLAPDNNVKKVKVGIGKFVVGLIKKKIKKTLVKAIPEAKGHLDKLKGLVPFEAVAINSKNINPLYVNDLKKVINDQPYIKEFTKNTKISEFYSQVGKNETAILGDDVGYIGRNNLFKKYGLKKDTFKKLFPPGMRYFINQQKTGNCYFLAGIYKALTDSKKQHKIYSMFEQAGDKVKVTLPYPAKYPVEFDMNDMSWCKSKTLARSCPGINMIELSYGINKYLKQFTNKRAIEIIEKGIDFQAISKKVTGGHMDEVLNELLGEGERFYREGDKNFALRKVAEGESKIVGIATKSRKNPFITSTHAFAAEVDPTNSKRVLSINPHNTLKVKRRRINLIKPFTSEFYLKKNITNP